MAPATKKWGQVRSAAPVTSGKPPNISDDHVSCTAPATENASLQILFKCPTPAIVFGNATKPSRFAHFWQGAQSLAPATRNDIWTSRTPQFFAFLTSKCASHHNGARFFDISTSTSAPECPEPRKRVILHILVIYYFTVIYCKFVGTQMKLVNTFTFHLNMWF